MRNEDIKEVLDAKLSGFKAEIKSGLDIQTYKLDKLIEYQEKQDAYVKSINKAVSKNTQWRIRLVAGATAVAGVFGFVLVKFGYIITTLRELINPE